MRVNALAPLALRHHLSAVLPLNILRCILCHICNNKSSIFLKKYFDLLTLLFLAAAFTRYTFAEVPKVTLSISPAGQADAGEDIAFTVTVDGFVNPEYQFGYRSIGGNWTARKKCLWFLLSPSLIFHEQKFNRRGWHAA